MGYVKNEFFTTGLSSGKFRFAYAGGRNNKKGFFESFSAGRDARSPRSDAPRAEGSKIGEGEWQEGGYGGEDVGFFTAIEKNFNFAVEMFVFHQCLAATTARGNRIFLKSLFPILSRAGILPSSDSEFLYRHSGPGR